MNKDRIALLAGDFWDKRQRREALEMQNTPSDPAEARKAYIEYQIAAAEETEAKRLLNSECG